MQAARTMTNSDWIYSVICLNKTDTEWHNPVTRSEWVRIYSIISVKYIYIRPLLNPIILIKQTCMQVQAILQVCIWSICAWLLPN